MPTPLEILRDEVIAVQEKWVEAGRETDPAKYAALMTDRFFCVTLLRSYLTRAEFLENIESAQRHVHTSSFLETPRVEFYGPTVAVLNGRIHFKADLRGLPFDGPVLITATWIKEDGAWKCATYHSSDVRLDAAWDELRRK